MACSACQRRREKARKIFQKAKRAAAKVLGKEQGKDDAPKPVGTQDGVGDASSG